MYTAEQYLETQDKGQNPTLHII